MTAVAPIPDSYWLVQDRLLAGEYPGSFAADAARTKLERFVDAGIRSFIDLTHERDRLERYDTLLDEIARERQIECRYQRFGIRDLGVPSREQMASILGAIRVEIEAGRPVYFHCWGGIGRTGTVAGCWLVEQGLSGDEAIEYINERRRATPDGYRQSPETEEQRLFIRQWNQQTS